MNDNGIKCLGDNGVCIPLKTYSYEKKKTNADKIREMSDEELAEFIIFGATDCSDYCPDFKSGCSFGCKHNHGKDVLIKWLQSEAE